MRLRGGICVSVQRPASSGEIRPRCETKLSECRNMADNSGHDVPSGTTLVASIQIAPTPRAANACRGSQLRSNNYFFRYNSRPTPIWTRCQSVACPLSELYWHIGD